MSVELIANVITVFSVIFLAVIALIVGYTAGYEDAKKHCGVKK